MLLGSFPAEPGMSWYGSTAPVPISVCRVAATPIEGRVAVPTIRTENGRGPPSVTVTTSPTFLCSCARVIAPSTTCPCPCRPWPDSSGGVTGAFVSVPRTGTVTPSICAVPNQTPVHAATSGSWLRTAVVWLWLTVMTPELSA
jgi:hypothetical protein